MHTYDSMKAMEDAIDNYVKHHIYLMEDWSGGSTWTKLLVDLESLKESFDRFYELCNGVNMM